jgi:hypothetical protein
LTHSGVIGILYVGPVSVVLGHIRRHSFSDSHTELLMTDSRR